MLYNPRVSHSLHDKGYESALFFNQTLRNDFSCTYMKWNVKRVSKRLADGPGLSACALGFPPKRKFIASVSCYRIVKSQLLCFLSHIRLEWLISNFHTQHNSDDIDTLQNSLSTNFRILNCRIYRVLSKKSRIFCLDQKLKLYDIMGIVHRTSKPSPSHLFKQMWHA